MTSGYSASEGASRPVVLFDGSCPLCSREIAHYRRCREADRIHWLDVSVEGADCERLGVTRAAALARFHVRDDGGLWHDGAAAFVKLWSYLPAYRWIARTVKRLRLLPLMEWAYVRFLRLRQRRVCTA